MVISEGAAVIVACDVVSFNEFHQSQPDRGSLTSFALLPYQPSAFPFSRDSQTFPNQSHQQLLPIHPLGNSRFLMLDDLLELTGTLVHQEGHPHSPTYSASKFDTMPPRSRHSKSASVASSTGGSTAVASNGEMLPPAPASPITGSKSSSPVARKRRGSSRQSHTSAPASPIVVIPAKQKSEPVPTRPSYDLPTEVGKFVVTVVLSAILEAGLQTVAGTIGVGDLAAVSKRPESWFDIIGLLGWKIIQLGFYWFSGFDGTFLRMKRAVEYILTIDLLAYDVASLSLLLSTPTTLLLGLFYDISPSTLISTTLCSILATSAPYYFLRPISPSHSPGSAPRSSLRNRPILTDPYTTIATSLLAAAIFAVLLEASFATFLPRELVLHFVGLRSIEAAHLGPSGLPTLLLALLPAGIAVQEYIFAPSTATPMAPVAPFDPVTASLVAHVYQNTWGWYSARQKELIGRTAILTYLIVAHTIVQVWGTIEGVEWQGALEYAAIWGLGSVVVGIVLDWVGGPSD